jgi:hypothetical protein
LASRIALSQYVGAHRSAHYPHTDGWPRCRDDFCGLAKYEHRRPSVILKCNIYLGYLQPAAPRRAGSLAAWAAFQALAKNETAKAIDYSLKRLSALT